MSNPATVYAPPVPPGNLIIESREDVVSEGNETEITCTAMGGKPASSIIWMKGDQILQGQIHTPSAALFPIPRYVIRLQRARSRSGNPMTISS